MIGDMLYLLICAMGMAKRQEQEEACFMPLAHAGHAARQQPAVRRRQKPVVRRRQKPVVRRRQKPVVRRRDHATFSSSLSTSSAAVGVSASALESPVSFLQTAARMAPTMGPTQKIPH